MSINNLYNIPYYFKAGGLSKFWEGYDNEPIVVIDDPVTPGFAQANEQIQYLKNVISTGNVYVEVKYGSMVFDAHILIFTSNLSPYILANDCGAKNMDAVFRRLTDTIPSMHIKSKEQGITEIPFTLCKYLEINLKHYGLLKTDFDLDLIADTMGTLDVPDYNV